jgi:hypothetical protein
VFEQVFAQGGVSSREPFLRGGFTHAEQASDLFDRLPFAVVERHHIARGPGQSIETEGNCASSFAVKQRVLRAGARVYRGLECGFGRELGAAVFFDTAGRVQGTMAREPAQPRDERETRRAKASRSPPRAASTSVFDRAFHLASIAAPIEAPFSKAPPRGKRDTKKNKYRYQTLRVI